jgi:hypothetical protein
VLVAGACNGDPPEGRVPQRDRPADSPPGVDPGGSDGPFEPISGRAFPPGTARVAVEGAPLGVPTGSIRALLAMDLDGDGARDAILVLEVNGGASVAFARRGADAFGAIEALGELHGPREGCTVGEPALRTVSPSFAVLSVTRTCDGAQDRALGVLGLAGGPRLLERIALLPPEGRTAGEVTLGLAATDVDQDGHTDVVLEVAVRGLDASEPARVRLPWLDRPGGLARDRAEPERTLAELASRARDALKKDTASALASARQALSLHGVLCREGGAPRLRFGESDGLVCGRSAGAGRAAAVAAAALAERGAVLESMEAEAKLGQPAYAVAAADRKLLERAWARAPTPSGLRWRKVADHAPGAMPDVHLPPASFADVGTLVLRGEASRAVDLTTGEARPAPEADGPGLMRDPSGELAVVGVHRSCEGHLLSIVRAADVVAGVVAGRPVAEPLLEARPPPSGSPCPPVPAALAKDTGGWQVLGWAPQGVVAARGETLRVVPLTVEGHAAGEPADLPPGTPPPAPLAPGQATPDATAYVLPSARGVILRRLAPAARTVLLRPEGWKDGAIPSSVAISPDGTKVAVLRDGEVWVIEGVP